MSTTTNQKSVRYMDAVRQAIADEMEADASVVLMGIDVGRSGGVFAVTRGLVEQFGPERVRDTPISEMAYVGAAVGAAAAGLKPIVELMFMDFLGVCFDPLLNQASKLRYMTGGSLSFPLVVRTQTGAGRSSGAQHSQHLEAMLAHVPGLKVVMPGTVSDAYGLLRASIQDPNPVVYIENRRLYGRKGVLPEGSIPILGEAAVRRTGTDVTVITYSRLVETALRVAEALEGERVSVEVIDLRTIAPIDMDAILGSVRRTRRAVIAHEAVRDFGVGAEIAARITEEAWDTLAGPVRRVGAPSVPLPFSPPLEAACIPDEEALTAAVRLAVRA